MTTIITIRAIPASEVQPSDTIRFAGSEYKVRSVLLSSHAVRISFWGTNEEQHYFYEPSEPMDHVTYVEARCACDDSDVYDGYAECQVHPQED